MATKYINTKYTLLDRAKETIDGKNVLGMISVMNEQVDDFFMDVPFVEANMGLKHKLIRDTGMVASTNRSFYQGVPASKRNKQTVYEDVALMERRREIDEDEIDTLSNRGEKLRQEDEGHTRKLGEDVVNEFINGTQGSGSEYINGLLQRLDTINPSGLNNVHTNGHTAGTGTRILVVEWNTDRSGGAHGIYPPGWVKGTALGVTIRDKKKEPVKDADNTANTYYAYVAQYKAWLGLAVGNNRKIGCLCNINTTLGGSNSFADGAVENLILLLHAMRINKARTRIYVNNTIAAHMDIYSLNKSNIIWPTTEVFGRPVKNFQGIPIREIDTTILTDSLEVLTT